MDTDSPASSSVTTHYHDEWWLEEVFSNLKKKGYIVEITWREDGRPG